MTTALHIPCLVQTHRPQLIQAMLHVGERLGWQFTIPKGQTCCGLPAWEAGYEDAARTAAKRTIKLFASADSVLTPSIACLKMLQTHIPDLLGEGNLEANALAHKSRSWCSMLGPSIDDLRQRIRYSGRIILLESCGAPGCPDCRTLFEQIEGLQILHAPVGCCSFRHDFSRRHPDIAASIAETIALPLVHSRADVILVHEPGCLHRLAPYFQDSDSPRLLHPAEFIAAMLQ